MLFRHKTTYASDYFFYGLGLHRKTYAPDHLFFYGLGLHQKTYAPDHLIFLWFGAAPQGVVYPSDHFIFGGYATRCYLCSLLFYIVSFGAAPQDVIYASYRITWHVVRNTLFSCKFGVAPQGIMYVAYHLVLHCLGLRQKT